MNLGLSQNLANRNPLLKIGESVEKIQTQLQGTKTYNEILKELQKVIQTDPELGLKYSGQIKNLNEDEVRKMIISIINDLQKRQIKAANYKKFDEKYDEKRRNTNWQNFYKEYYTKRQDNLAILLNDLGIQNNQSEISQNIIMALTQLELQNEITYNPQQKSMISLKIPNKTGTSGIKINVSGLNKLLMAKIEATSQDQDEDQKKFLFNQIKLSEPYKYIKDIIDRLKFGKQSQKKRRDLTQYAKPLTKKQIINKIKGKYNQFIANPKYKSNIERYGEPMEDESYLKKFEMQKDIPVFSDETAISKANADDKTIINLQNQLQYVPEELQKQYATIIKKRQDYAISRPVPRSFPLRTGIITDL